MKTHVIQIDRHDDATSVIDKIKWSKANRILLVWPKRGRVLTRMLDLLLIQRACQNAGAQLACVAEDEDVLDHTQELGIPVFRSSRAAEKIPWRKTRKKKGFETRSFHPFLFFEEMKAGFRSANAGWWEKRFIRWTVFTVGLIAVLALLVFLLPGAKVHLTMEVEEQSVDLQVRASSELREINLSGGIPASTIDTIVEGQGSIQTTGSMILPDRSASGQVKFSNLTDQRVMIPAGTMVQTTHEPFIQYRTLRDVELDAIPGTQKEVSIQAVQAGSQGNIRSGQIQAVIGSMGTKVSVINTGAVIGGSDISVSTASKSDIDHLRNQIISELKDSALQELAKSEKFEEKLLPQTLQMVKIQEETVEPAIGLPADHIQMIMRVEYNALAYREADLETIAHAALDATLDRSKNPLQGSLMIIEIEPPTSEDTQVHWKVKASQLVQTAWDSSKLIKALAGQTEANAIKNLGEIPGLVESPQIILSPTWWPVLPLLPARIEVEVR